MKLSRTNGPMPPGGYPFTDPRTGLRFHGMEGQFETQVRKIIEHRLANPAVYYGYSREYFAPVAEELLRRVEDPAREPDYFEIFSPWWRSSWRSESLGEDTLSTLRVDDWVFDDTHLSPSLEPVRRVVLRVPRQFSPFPQRRTRSKLGSGDAPAPQPS